MFVEVGQRGLQHLDAVRKGSEAGVVFLAKQTSDPSGYMIVINVELITSFAIWRSSADSTPSTLSDQSRLVILDADPIRLPDPTRPSLAWISFAPVPIPGVSLLGISCSLTSAI